MSPQSDGGQSRGAAGLTDLVRERGPLTVAAFMDLALYDPDVGYYARAAQRTGRSGDFFTSVDVGPLFGQLLAGQIAEMAAILGEHPPAGAGVGSRLAQSVFALVEAGAGNGRLSADILRTMKREHQSAYERTSLHLVEISAAARAPQREVLADVADRLASSSSELPETFEGVLVANELLDAMPVHQVVMRQTGLREIYVTVEGDALVEREGPLSTPRLDQHLATLGVQLEPGWRAEVSLRAIDWVRDAARRLTRGFLVLIDYGHEARELYSARHAAGTLTTYARHSASDSGSPTAWLQQAGHRDITAHVDFTSVQASAATEGTVTLGLLDQMYFLLALGTDRLGSLTLKERLALKTLILPGGLGSTMKVLVLGKGVGRPVLTGCPSTARLT